MHNPVPVSTPHSVELSSEAQLKIAASALIAVSAIVLLVQALGDMIGGDLTGAQHIAQAAVFVVPLVAGWRYPRVTGILLSAIAAVLFVLWMTIVIVQAEPAFRGLVGLLLFAPSVIAGALLVRAARENSRD